MVVAQREKRKLTVGDQGRLHRRDDVELGLVIELDAHRTDLSILGLSESSAF